MGFLAMLPDNEPRPLLLRILDGESTKRPAVWLMRQAGRYMSSYRALKEKYSFFELCSNPDLATEVTMQPMREFSPDAAIIFSDILFPLRDMGIKVDFLPGPVISNPISDPKGVAELIVSTGFAEATVSKILASVKSALKVESRDSVDNSPAAVIGFAGAPWTLACYMIKQSPYKHFEGTSIFAKEHPRAFADLMDKLTETIEHYLLAQYRAGADAVQIFDSWGGGLSATEYRHYALPAIKRIVSTLQSAGCPCILYIGNGSHLVGEGIESGARCLSVDWRTKVADVYASSDFVGKSIVVQGNLDPTDLFLPPADIRIRTKAMMAECSKHSHYIANLGHGVLQHTPVAAVHAFVDAVKEGWVS